MDDDALLFCEVVVLPLLVVPALVVLLNCNTLCMKRYLTRRILGKTPVVLITVLYYYEVIDAL